MNGFPKTLHFQLLLSRLSCHLSHLAPSFSTRRLTYTAPVARRQLLLIYSSTISHLVVTDPSFFRGKKKKTISTFLSFVYRLCQSNLSVCMCPLRSPSTTQAISCPSLSEPFPNVNFLSSLSSIITSLA